MLKSVSLKQTITEKIELSIEDLIKFSNEIVIVLIPKNPLDDEEHAFIDIL